MGFVPRILGEFSGGSRHFLGRISARSWQDLAEILIPLAMRSLGSPKQPQGSPKEAKECQQSAKGTPKAAKGGRKRGQREPKEAKREAKGSQRAAKMHPKVDLRTRLRKVQIFDGCQVTCWRNFRTFFHQISINKSMRTSMLNKS